MSSRMMTILGCIVAALGFVGTNLPEGSPEWLKLLIGALLAASAGIGGLTHPGTRASAGGR